MDIPNHSTAFYASVPAFLPSLLLFSSSSCSTCRDPRFPRLGNRLTDAAERLQQVHHTLDLLQQLAHRRHIAGVARVGEDRAAISFRRQDTVVGTGLGAPFLI